MALSTRRKGCLSTGRNYAGGGEGAVRTGACEQPPQRPARKRRLRTDPCLLCSSPPLTSSSSVGLEGCRDLPMLPSDLQGSEDSVGGSQQPSRLTLEDEVSGCLDGLTHKGLSFRQCLVSSTLDTTTFSPLGLAMVICPLLVSLRVCLERHPPLVTFFLCLLSFAVAFGSFAAYIQSHEVPDPDVKEDWNSLLTSLAHLMFCIPNKTHEDTSTSSPSTPAESHRTVSVLVGLTFKLQNGTDHPNGTHLSLTITGKELGLKGPDAQEPVHFVIAVNSLAHESCLSIIAPSSLLPQTRQPPKCVMGEREMHPEGPGLCYQSHYQANPALSGMLDQADRALCSQRLLLTSAFLLCLCAMLCCMAGLCYPAPRDRWGQI